MIIHCYTAEEFFDAVEALVRRGLTFEADFTKLCISLTGGF